LNSTPAAAASAPRSPAVLVPDDAPELRLVHEWLDPWTGLWLIVAGMTHQGWDLQLTAYVGRDWRPTFLVAGIAHSIVGGSAWEPTACRAVQRAGGIFSGQPAGASPSASSA